MRTTTVRSCHSALRAMPETRSPNSRPDDRLPSVDELLAASDWPAQLARARERRAAALRGGGAKRPLPVSRPWESDDYLTATGVLRPRRAVPAVATTPRPPPRLRRTRSVPVLAALAVAGIGAALAALAIVGMFREGSVVALTTAPEAPDLPLEAMSLVAAVPDGPPPAPDPVAAGFVPARPAAPAPDPVGGPSGLSPAGAHAVVPATPSPVPAGVTAIRHPSASAGQAPDRSALASLPAIAAPDPFLPTGPEIARPPVAEIPASFRVDAVAAAPHDLLFRDHAPVARMPLPPLGGAGAVETAELRVAVFFPDGGGDARAGSVISALDAAGFEVASAGAVGVRISATHVRYFHADDAERAGWLAAAVGGEVRDFTRFSPEPPAGAVEVWLAGDPAPARSSEERQMRSIGGVIRWLFSGPGNGRSSG